MNSPLVVSTVDPKNLGLAKKAPLRDFQHFCDAYYKIVDATSEKVEKSSLVALCTGTFKEGIRNSVNFIKSGLLPIDLDDPGNDRDQIINDLDNSDLRYLFIESPGSNGRAFKGRVYLQLNEDITDFKKWAQGYVPTIKEYFPKWIPDKKAKDAPHFFYIPNRSKLSTFKTRSTGKTIKFIVPEEKKEAVPEKSFSLTKSSDEIINELDYRLAYLKEQELSITEEYDDWVSVGFSIAGCQKFNVSAEDCRRYFHEFSKLDKSYNSKECAKKFDDLLGKADMSKCGPEKIFSLCTEKGYGKKKESGKVYVVEDMRTSRYFMALKNTGNENRVKLDPRPNEFNVCLALAKDSTNLALTSEEIGFKNKQGKRVYLKQETVKARYRDIPLRKAMLLGEKEPGIYYNKEKSRLEEADHGIIESKPIKHEEIDVFLDGFPIKKEWMQKYLAYLTDCTKALPWLHFFGESNSGKSLFGKLLASCFTTKTPVNDFFLVDGFQDSAGHNPVLMIGEQIPRTRGGIETVNLIKEMITSYEWTVNKKHTKGTCIVGYPRVISTMNTSQFEMPIGDLMDFGALRRRIQLGKFEKEHVKHMGRFSKSKIDSWFDCKFREYVAWCGVNISASKEEQKDVLIISSYATADLDTDSINISDDFTNIIHELLNRLSKKTKDSVYKCYEDKNFYFTLSQDFTKELHKDRITQKLINTKKLSSLCYRVFGDLEKVVKRVGGGQYRCRVLPQKIFEKAVKEVNFEVD